MNIGYNNPIGLIISTSRKNSNNTNFCGSDTMKTLQAKKQEFSSAVKDEEKRYSMIGVFAGIAALATVGFALLNKEKTMVLLKRLNNGIRELFSHKKSKLNECLNGADGGVKVDFSKGKKSIHIAWTDHINTLHERRKNNPNIFRYFQEVFSENSERLDELEEKAKLILMKKNRKLAKRIFK